MFYSYQAKFTRQKIILFVLFFPFFLFILDMISDEKKIEFIALEDRTFF